MIWQKNHFEKGITLVEMMMSLTLSLILMLSFVQAFLIIKNIFLKQQGLARIQENARATYEILNAAVMQSGNMGCNRMTDEIGFFIDENVNKTQMGLLPFNGMVAEKERWPQHIRHREVLSDLLWVKYVKKSYPMVYLSHYQDYLVIQGSPKWKKGKILILSDCRHADIFRLTDEVQKINSTQTKIVFKRKNESQIYYKYPSSAVVSKLYSEMYYVAKTGRFSQDNEAIKALYSSDANGKTQERVEGVESLQLVYGVREKDKLIYLSSEKIRDFHKIVSIKVFCVFSTVNAVKFEKNKNRIHQEFNWEWAFCC